MNLTNYTPHQKVKLHGSNIFKCQLSLEDIYNLDQEHKLGRWYAINRSGDVWGELKRRELISSILEELDLPKFYISLQDRNLINGIDTTRSPEDRGKRLLEILIDDADDNSVRFLDGLQRATSILQFREGKLKTKGGLMIGGRDVGKLTFYDLPSEVREKFSNYLIDTTIYVGPDNEAVEYFHRLNAGVPLAKQEKANAYQTEIANYIRNKANVVSPDPQKFECFRCVPGASNDSEMVSKLLNTKYGRRMKFDKWLNMVISYSAIQSDVIKSSTLRESGKLASQTWNDLTKVPILGTSNTFDLKHEVETIFSWINDILKCPRKQSQVTCGEFLNLYMVIHDLFLLAKMGNKSVVLEDPIEFAKTFFTVHYHLYATDKVFEFATRGLTLKELNIRLRKICESIGSKKLGVKFI